MKYKRNDVIKNRVLRKHRTGRVTIENGTAVLPEQLLRGLRKFTEILTQTNGTGGFFFFLQVVSLVYFVNVRTNDRCPNTSFHLLNTAKLRVLEKIETITYNESTIRVRFSFERLLLILHRPMELGEKKNFKQCDVMLFFETKIYINWKVETVRPLSAFQYLMT